MITMIDTGVILINSMYRMDMRPPLDHWSRSEAVLGLRVLP